MLCDISHAIVLSSLLNQTKMKKLISKFWNMDREQKGYLLLGLGIFGLLAYTSTLVIGGYRENDICRGILSVILISLWSGLYIMSGNFFKSDEKLSAKYFLGGLMVIGLIMFGFSIIGNMLEILSWNISLPNMSWPIYIFCTYLGVTLLIYMGNSFRKA